MTGQDTTGKTAGRLAVLGYPGDSDGDVFDRLRAESTVDLTVVAGSDPAELGAAAASTAVDCILIPYDPSMPEEITAGCKQAAADRGVPCVAYCESASALSAAREQGVADAHLRHDDSAADTVALLDRLRAVGTADAERDTAPTAAAADTATATDDTTAATDETAITTAAGDLGPFAALHRTLTETSGTFEERVTAMLDVGQAYLGMDAGIVASVSDDSYRVEIIDSDDELLGSVPAGASFPLSETYCDRTLDQGSTYRIDNVHTDAPELTELAAAETYGSVQYIGTPIRIDGATYGTLCFHGTDTDGPSLTDEDQLLVEFMAQLVTYELQHHLQKEELRATQNELRAVFSRVDDAFFALDDDWRFVYVNDRAESLLGIDAEEVVGEIIWDAFPAAKDTIFEERYTHAVDSQESVSFEAPFAPLDAWFEVTAYPDEEGLSVYFRDVSERKQRRDELERYEQILDTVSDGVYALNEDEQFTYVNDGLAELTGYDREGLIGSHIGLFKSESTIETAREAVTAAFHEERTGNGDGETQIDLTVETADGREIPCQDHIALLPFEEEFRGSVGTIRDISDQVEREATLNELLTRTRELMVAETPTAVAETVVETVTEALGFDRAMVRWYDEETDRLVPAATSETVTAEVGPREPIAPGEGLVGEAFATGEAIVCEPVGEGTDVGEAATLSAVPIGETAVLVVGVPDPEECSQQTRQLIQLVTTNAEAAFARTAREQSLRRYESIVETVREMLCVIDADGRFKLLTEPLADRLGRSRAGLLGEAAIEFVAAEDQQRVTDAFRELGDDETITIDTTLMPTDGESLPVTIEAARLTQAGGAGEVIISIHDRSELLSAKRTAAAERERFSYLFDNLTDPINEIDIGTREPRVETVNGAFQRLFGEPTVEGSIPDSEEPRPLAIDADRIVDTDTPGQRQEGDRELKLRTENGIRYFLFRQVPYELNEDRRRFELYTDITTLKQRELQLQVLHRLLRHNLRNDLNVISGFAEILAAELEGDRHRDFAERIVANTSELIELSETAKTIEDVGGQRSLDRTAIELGELLKPTVRSYQTDHPEATVTLSASTPVIVGAGDHLATAVGELIENGIEHNPSTPPTVEISVAADGETASITVSDNGAGVPAEEWAIVTGDSEISQLEHGSGLGLWLVRWVIEGYGGTLDRRIDGDGASVVIELPIVSDEHEAAVADADGDADDAIAVDGEERSE
ncbi:PAS domain S-box protein [Halonotius roseus]|uniref:histidine kinase n=1 Tax=Halonotius roseus TaxID=2511997 RepID=A0A544QM03_9EURY|nr:PAS domain S-box protein [Halonotius roseus]TQQ79620.1 PAS domain S-box protein [Halonotius roseus]